MYLLLKADQPLKLDHNAGMSYTCKRKYDGPTLHEAATRASKDLAHEHQLRRLRVSYNHTDPDQATCVIYPEFNLVLMDERHTRSG